METGETFTMSHKEVPRAGLLKAALAGKISNAQGAQALHLSVRQFQRLKTRFRVDGVPGLLHRLRGRSSPRRLHAALRARAAALLQSTYASLNDCHATEKLREIDGVCISRSTVRRLRRALGLPAKRRRRRRTVRTRRTPAAQRGALVQLDACVFPWLGDGGPLLALHGAIDDATGAGLALVLRPAEDLHGYVILRELGIGFIPAGSPQAKGRIERFWQTLQDRLVAELRLRGITTLNDAHAFFPAFLADLTARFARAPAETQAVWRPAPRALAAVLSCRYPRTVAPDNTVRLGPRWMQLPRRRSYAGRRVEVRECLDGRLLVFTEGRCLAAQPAPGPDFVLRPRRSPNSTRPRRPRRPLRPEPAAGHYPPGRSPAFSSRARPAPTRKPSPAHPWRHSTPYSPRKRRDILTEQLT